MTMPKEHEFASQVAYARALEDYCENKAAELAAARAEIERKMSAGQFVLEQLATEQAKNVGLRKEFQSFIDSHEECEDFDGFTAQTVSMDDYHSATGSLEATPSETSALEAIVKKAGEVMRKRCVATCNQEATDAFDNGETDEWARGVVMCSELISLLPAVTLDDLKGG